MDKEHYNPAEIHFTKDSVLWVLQNLPLLRSGNWPPDASNYIDIPLGKLTGHKAPFEIPIQCACEIELRLERCGVDGLILEAIECWGKTEESLCSYFNFPLWSVRKRWKGALAYISSGNNVRWHTTSKRKGLTYKEFRAKRK